MTLEAVRLEDRLCSLSAQAAIQDPICSTGYMDRVLVFESPLPWGDSYYDADANGTLRQRIYAIREAYNQRRREDAQLGKTVSSANSGLYGIQPDKEWSRPDQIRVLTFARPDSFFSQYEVAEYLFPADTQAIVEMVNAHFNAPRDFTRFEDYRIDHAGYRELLVCTHGHVDICCAKFGVPLYNQARAAFPQVRAWRVTHFGGHRFAPTAWEFPSGYKWAFMDREATERVLRQDEDPSLVGGKIRGWSGAEVQAQTLDREGLKRYGWRWQHFKRLGRVLEADKVAKRWRVRLDFESPAGETGSYEGTVIIGRKIKSYGCGPHWGEHEGEATEYQLIDFQET